jgi:outer membrane protein TolC
LSEHRVSFWPALLVAGIAVWAGCRSQENCRFQQSTEHFQAVATQVEYPDSDVQHREQVFDTPPPRTVADAEKVEYWALSLDEAISTALANSQVIRDAGGMILSGPSLASTVSTVYDPALRDTDPRGGVEVALSAFDAQLAASVGMQHKDRSFNNILFTGDPRDLVRDGGMFNAQLSKIGAAGTQFTLSNITTFDQGDALWFGQNNNSALNLFQGEIRQPLLQGAGVEYNRIAGPHGRPGLYSGVVLARINTDIGLADFEQAVNNLLNNVERAYWDLYVAYRDLDAKMAAREMALQTWRNVYQRFQAGATDHEEEARSREQFYLFNSAVLNSLNGIPSPVGFTPFSSGPTNGVYALDRRLRWLLGLPPSDGKLIRPADEPSTAHVTFDWHDSLREALCRRVELRKQQWLVKRRQLELIAARNMLKVRLDAVGQYRALSLDHELLDDDSELSGNLQQWQVGLQLATPLGNRIGHNAVRNAELFVAREKAIYRDQELRITHELSDAMAELERAYAVSRSNFNAGLAAYQHLQEIGKKYDAGVIPLEFLLDAQRRVVEANNGYYRSLIDYNVSIVGFQNARGTLLEYHEVQLAEGPWSDEAYASAAKQAQRFKPRVLNYVFETPPAVSQGRYERHDMEQDRILASQPQAEKNASAPAPPTAAQPTPAAPTPQRLPEVGRPPASEPAEAKN